MTNCPFTSIDEIDDIHTIDQYDIARDAGLSEQEALQNVCRITRDNARTPVQWDNSRNAGFTAGTPWLKVNPNFDRINVQAQLKDENSVLNFYRKLTALRKDPRYAETIVYGSFEPILTDIENLYALFRNLYVQDLEEDQAPFTPSVRTPLRQSILVLANCQNTDITVSLPADGYDTILLNNCDTFTKSGRTVSLLPFQAVILLL